MLKYVEPRWFWGISSPIYTRRHHRPSSWRTDISKGETLAFDFPNDRSKGYVESFNKNASMFSAMSHAWWPADDSHDLGSLGSGIVPRSKFSIRGGIDYGVSTNNRGFVQGRFHRYRQQSLCGEVCVFDIFQQTFSAHALIIIIN